MALLPYKSIVTVPAASKDMTLLATVKTELGITDAASDAKLSALIQQASAAIVSFCKREFAQETLADTFRTDCGDSVLQLSRRPIVSVTSIVEDDVSLTAADYEIIAANGWIQRIDSEERPIGWAWGKTVVTYVAGWIMLTNLPSDLERACIDLIKGKWFALERDPLVKSESTPGVYSVDYWVQSGESVRGLPADVARQLEELGYVEVIA
jgi:hypothetical protein